MPGGRPLKFKSAEELWEKADAYFQECKAASKPLTITGTALALDTTRDLLWHYEGRDEFSDTIAKIKLTVEAYAENQLYEGKNAAGPVFALKNYGWQDKSGLDLTGNLQITGLGTLLAEQDGETKGI